MNDNAYLVDVRWYSHGYFDHVVGRYPTLFDALGFALKFFGDIQIFKGVMLDSDLFYPMCLVARFATYQGV